MAIASVMIMPWNPQTGATATGRRVSRIAPGMVSIPSLNPKARSGCALSPKMVMAKA
ncbi:hypothetical protein D3C80_1982360 [compost metagenome]